MIDIKVNNNGSFEMVIKNIKGLSEEGRKKVIRRARDTFNKNVDAQLEMTANMIIGNFIRIDDLC